MSTQEWLMLVGSADAGPFRMKRTRAVALQAIQTASGTAREALFACAMTGSAIASLAIIATPRLEMLLSCILHSPG